MSDILGVPSPIFFNMILNIVQIVMLGTLIKIELGNKPKRKKRKTP